MNEKYLVSYQLIGYPNHCGNQSFDSVEEMKKYIETNQSAWSSYSEYSFFEVGFINDLIPLEEKCQLQS